MIGPLSRYASIEQATLVLPDGREVRYLRRRFVPHPEQLALLDEYVVVLGDRLDRIAAAELGDCELFWRIADGNRANPSCGTRRAAGTACRDHAPRGYARGDPWLTASPSD